MAIVVGIATPRRYTFIDQFAGVRDVKEEQQLIGIAEGMGGAPPHSIKIECYTFRAPIRQVRAAAIEQLTKSGWLIIEKDDLEVIFQKGKESAMFCDNRDMGDPSNGTCMVILPGRSNWLLDRWEALKAYLGLK